MATVSISQLDTATQAKVDDLYEVAVVDENSQTGYASRKLTAAQIATLFAQGVQFSGLSTAAKTIIAAINEAAQNGGSEVEPNPTGEPTDTLEKIGIDGTIYEVGGSEPVSKTVTGNPISITDGAAAPIVSGEVTFEPVQDLHGYDKPWVGGAGKNKFPLNIATIKSLNTTGTWTGNVYTIGVFTFTINTDDDGNITSITGNGTGAESQLKLIQGSVLNELTSKYGDLILSGCPQGGGEYTYGIRIRRSTNLYQGEYGNGLEISSARTYNDYVLLEIHNNQVANNLKFQPMLRLATESDATFAPYSNICPIEGYTDCEVEVTGKNLLKLNIESGTTNGITLTVNSDGTFTANGTATAQTVLPLNDETYFDTHLIDKPLILSGCPSGGSETTYKLQAWYSAAGGSPGQDYGSGVQFTPNQATLIRLVIRSGVTLSNIVFKPMLRLATETDATFEPYQSTTYTIDIDGTRYGGKVNPVSGVMTVTQGYIATYAGETIGEPWLSDRDEYVAGTTPTTGAEVVYTLATPTTVQLTPEHIRTLEGTNNISTNMTSMSLEYITQDYQPLVDLAENNGDSSQFQPVIYSFEEREIGVWTDGKPLYQKTFDIGALTEDSSFHNVAHNISSIDKVIFISGTAHESNGSAHPLSDYRAGSSYGITVGANLTNIFYSNNWLTVIDCTVTLCYTKTTDTPGSGTWTPSGVPAVHYSTDEHVVGTWIDGSTIYERTYDLGSDLVVSYDSFTETSIDASSMSRLVGNPECIYSTGATAYPVITNINSNNRIALQTTRNGAVANVRYVTIRYTKVTT